MEENNTQNSTQVQNSSGLDLKSRISKIPAIPAIGGLVLAIAVVAIIVVVFIGNRPNPKVTALVESGNASLNRADYTKAQQSFKEAYAIQQGNPVVQAGLINSYSRQGNQQGTENDQLETTKPFIDTALKTNPNDVNVLNAIGYAYESAGDFKKAEEYYRRATEADPKSSTAWFNLGHVLEFQGDGDKANELYDKAYKLDPKNPMVNMARANKQFSDKKLDDAYNSYKTAANEIGISNATSAEALTGAAAVLLNKDNLEYVDQANAIAKQAVDANPNYAPALSLYGFTSYLIGQEEQGIDYLKRAIEANPRISKNYYLLGGIYRTEDDLDNAINYFQQAVGAVDDDNTVLADQEQKNNIKSMYMYELAKTYDLAGQSDQALTTLKGALSLNSALLNILTQDYNSGARFTNLAQNPEFQALMGQ